MFTGLLFICINLWYTISENTGVWHYNKLVSSAFEILITWECKEIKMLQLFLCATTWRIRTFPLCNYLKNTAHTIFHWFMKDLKSLNWRIRILWKTFERPKVIEVTNQNSLFSLTSLGADFTARRELSLSTLHISLCKVYPRIGLPMDRAISFPHSMTVVSKLVLSFSDPLSWMSRRARASFH